MFHGERSFKMGFKGLFKGNVVGKTSQLDKNSISKNMETGDCMHMKQQTQNMKAEKHENGRVDQG